MKEIGKIHPGRTKLSHFTSKWLLYAHELKKTEELIYMDILKDWDFMQIQKATKVFKPHPVTPTKTHYLIIGLALENLLKCIFLNKHPEILNGGKIEDKMFKSHNLVQIATQKLNLAVNDDEKFVFELATKSIKWYGRYPMPLKEEDTFLMLETNRTKIHIVFHTLFNRLVNLANSNPMNP